MLRVVKPFRPLLAALLTLAVPASVTRLLADDAVPKAQPAGRYEPMAARSPFMAPTAPGPTPPPVPVQAGPHWWDQMVVTSLMEAEGTFFAAVVDKANGKRYVLEKGKADESSLMLADVQWNEHAAQSTVTVRKGTDIAPPLRFDPSATASAPTGVPQPLAPARSQTPLAAPPLPPGFTGTPPPPPPGGPNVVRRSGPITSHPNAPAPQGTGALPGQPPVPPVRRVRPLSGNTGSDD